MLRFALLSLLLLPWVSAAAQASPAGSTDTAAGKATGAAALNVQNAPADAASAPGIGPSHIRVESLKLELDLPEGMQSRLDLSDRANAAFSKKSASGSPCAVNELTAFDASTIRQIRMLRYDAQCFQSPADAAQLRRTATALLRTLLSTHGKDSMTSPLDYEFSGIPATVVSGTVYSAKGSGLVFEEVGCMLFSPDIACWTFLANGPEKLARLAASPAKLDGKAPEAIVPESMSKMVELPSRTLHDDADHVEFTYPGSFADTEAAVETRLADRLQNGSDVEKQALRCVKSLLSATELRDEAASSLQVMRFDIGCAHLKNAAGTLQDLFRGEQKALASKFGGQTHKPVPYNIEGRTFLMDTTVIHAPGKPPRAMVVTCAWNERTAAVLCFHLSSTSLPRLRDVATSKVEFEGGQGSPVVPAELVPDVEIR